MVGGTLPAYAGNFYLADEMVEDYYRDWAEYMTAWDRESGSRQAIFNFLVAHCDYNREIMEKIVRYRGKKMMVEELPVEELLKYMPKHDAWSVITKATPYFADPKNPRLAKPKLAPLEFAVLYAELCESLGYAAEIWQGNIDSYADPGEIIYDQYGRRIRANGGEIRYEIIGRKVYKVSRWDFRVAFETTNDWIKTDPRSALRTGNALQYFDYRTDNDPYHFMFEKEFKYVLR